MTKAQLFAHITSNRSWHKQAGISINAASMLKKRFPLGQVSHERFVQLADKFGYKELPGDWVKEEQCTHEYKAYAINKNDQNSPMGAVCHKCGYIPTSKDSLINCTHP